MSEMPKLKDALLEVADKVATLTFNRDDVRNALTGTNLIDDIIDTLDWVEHSSEAHVLVITGAGKGFSSGGNVKDMHERSGMFSGNVEDIAAAYKATIQRIPLKFSQISFPVIAAINGAAVGAGFDLTGMCDIRIASTRAKFGENFVNIGLIPGDGGAYFLQRVVGYQRAAELTFTGRLFGAEEAKDIGYVLDVVEPEQLLTHAHELAKEIASKPPYQVRQSKLLMRKAQVMNLPDFLDHTAIVQGTCHHTDDHKQAVAEFVKRR
ncbi:enoyl-CoA hydratase-related protein [uncultured Maritalea sp.]|uniref:enoyl-CoA hydratase-related protein n=1 Tax=uncultured Maritalea sp. TaxID=757249 RepID=UPI0026092B17|nr:enoyl-CoA hydratase-related protein [uncultured Maritalea sp.]